MSHNEPDIIQKPSYLAHCSEEKRAVTNKSSTSGEMQLIFIINLTEGKNQPSNGMRT